MKDAKIRSPRRRVPLLGIGALIILTTSLVAHDLVITEEFVTCTRDEPTETRNATTGSQNQKDERVSFYLYPPKDFPLFWGPNSTCEHDKVQDTKHDHAVFAWHAMMQHPWRTTNPLEAELAILPLPLDLWINDGCGRVGRHSKRKKKLELIKEETRKVLEASPIFPSKRHLIIANNWKTNGTALDLMNSLLHPAGIWAGMEGRGECRISLGYTSNYAIEMLSLRNPTSAETPNPRRFGMERVHSVHVTASVDQRPAFRDRLALFQSNGHIPSPFIVSQYGSGNFRFKPNPKIMETHNALRRCNTSTSGNNADAILTSSGGDFDRCLLDKLDRPMATKAQEASNFTLCLRGDTLGSDRWINAMTAGTALIHVADDVQEALSWLPFPHAIPWKDMVITIPRKEYLQDPAKSIRHVLETTSEERLLKLQQLSLYHAADLDWTAHHSRVLENLLHDAVSVPCAAFDTYHRENPQRNESKR